MAIVQPGRPDPAQTAEPGGQIGASEPTLSESGMGLEATLPSVAPRPSAAENLTPLDEPSGAFASPSSHVNGPAPKPERTTPGATSLPATPLKDNLNARFERVL